MQDVIAVTDWCGQCEGAQETDEFGTGQWDELRPLLGGLVDGGSRKGEDSGGNQGEQ